jgi:hypothetical protein
LYRYVNRAIAQGELPKETDPDMVVRMLNAILSGVLMTLLRIDPMQIRPTYRAMLQFFWQWLRSESLEIPKESSTEDRQSREMTENIWMETYLLS